MATVPSSWPPAGCWWPPALDGGEVRRKIEQPRRAGCSRTLAEASSCSPADGSSYSEVANRRERQCGTDHERACHNAIEASAALDGWPWPVRLWLTSNRRD